MKGSLFFRSLLCSLQVMRESSILLGIAGMVSHMFQGGEELSAYAGIGFLFVAVFVSVTIESMGGGK